MSSGHTAVAPELPKSDSTLAVPALLDALRESITLLEIIVDTVPMLHGQSPRIAAIRAAYDRAAALVAPN